MTTGEISEARRRLGHKPVRQVFAQVAAPVATLVQVSWQSLAPRPALLQGAQGWAAVSLASRQNRHMARLDREQLKDIVSDALEQTRTGES